MKATELRLRNYVWGVSDRVEIVVKLENKKITTDHYLPEKLSAPHTSYEEFIEPIELNVKWLCRLGFAEVYNSQYAQLFRLVDDIDISFRIRKTEPGLPSGLILNGGHYDNIKYVHELQNLYFILTGKEL